MSKYYYLIAGLPEVALDDGRRPYTVADFKAEVMPMLSATDRPLFSLAIIPASIVSQS